jgi:hypothetical protein
MGGTRQSKEAELWRWRSILTVAFARIATFVTISAGDEPSGGVRQQRFTKRGGD